MAAPAVLPVRSTVTVAVADDAGTVYVDAESATTAGTVVGVLESLLVEPLVLELVLAEEVSVLEPPQAASVVSSAQMRAPRRTVWCVIIWVSLSIEPSVSQALL